MGAIIGIGIAYAGSGREEFKDSLMPLVMKEDINVEISAYAALSLGLIFVGLKDGDVS